MDGSPKKILSPSGGHSGRLRERWGSPVAVQGRGHLDTGDPEVEDPDTEGPGTVGKVGGVGTGAGDSREIAKNYKKCRPLYFALKM